MEEDRWWGYLDEYASFCTFVEKNFTLQKAIELFPGRNENSEKDRANPDKPYNHTWTKFREENKQCCLLIESMKRTQVYRTLLSWYEREGNSFTRDKSTTCQALFLCFRLDFTLHDISKILKRRVLETEQGAKDRNVAEFWLSLGNSDKLVLYQHFAARLVAMELDEKEEMLLEWGRSR